MVLLHPKTIILALAAPLAAATAQVAISTNLTVSLSGPLGNGVPLRIMPLGASITYGQASSDGNGYRAVLRERLVAGGYGNAVNMVGSRRAGTMRDSDVEGWPGFRIAEVHAKARASVPRWKPNVVLVNAGTNDATQGWNVGSAGQRMEDMVTDLWAMSPRAVVVLSTLLVNIKNAESERNVAAINRQFREVVKRLGGGEEEGKRIVLVDMQGEDGPGRGDLADDTHPNDEGYRKMADVWMKGLVAASDAGWLQAPEPVEGVPDDGAM